jgi:hypothetical protein
MPSGQRLTNAKKRCKKARNLVDIANRLGYTVGMTVKHNNESQNMKELVNVGIAIVAAGAREYMSKHNMKANPEVLAACCKKWQKIQMPVALKDAKEALACGMSQVAEATFKASLFQAGIEAAREAALPAAQLDHCQAISQA